jgi:hypothetical protein
MVSTPEERAQMQATEALASAIARTCEDATGDQNQAFAALVIAISRHIAATSRCPEHAENMAKLTAGAIRDRTLFELRNKGF